MPRPRVHAEPRVTTAVRLPPELHERLRRVADERQVSVNYIVVRSLLHYLDALIPIDQVQLTKRGDGRKAGDRSSV